MPLRFYERPTLEPTFTNWKKCKEDFHVYEKWWKAKIAVRVGFAVRGAWTEAARTWPASGALSAFRGNYTQRLCLEPRALNCAGAIGLHLHLLGASVSKVCPKYQKSPRDFIGGSGNAAKLPGEMNGNGFALGHFGSGRVSQARRTLDCGESCYVNAVFLSSPEVFWALHPSQPRLTVNPWINFLSQFPVS